MMDRRAALRSFAALGFAGMYRQDVPSLLIRGGRVVTAEGQKDADVRIHREKIAEVGPGLTPSSNEEVLDAKGLLVLPGGIDPHAHLSPPWADDFESGSKAAIGRADTAT